MSDTLGTPPAGSISPFLNDRKTVEETLRLLRRARDGFTPLGGGAPIDPCSPTLTVYVRNDTATAKPPFSVLKIGEPTIDVTQDSLLHECRIRPCLPGTAPSAATDPFVITLDNALPGETVRGAIMGGMVCDIEVSDAGHGFAAPSGSFTSKLASASSGPAKIVHKESGTGTKRAYVLMLGGTAGSGASVVTGAQDTGAHGISADDAWQATSAQITLPAAGTYLLVANVSCEAAISGGTYGVIYGRLYNPDDVSVVPGSHTVVWSGTSGGHTPTSSAPIVAVYTIGFADTIRVEVFRTLPGGGSFTLSNIITGSPPDTTLAYVRLT